MSNRSFSFSGEDEFLRVSRGLSTSSGLGSADPPPVVVSASSNPRTARMTEPRGSISTGRGQNWSAAASDLYLGQTFFIYDDSNAKETDPPEDLLVFFYPPVVPLERQLFLLGTVSAMLSFTSSFTNEMLTTITLDNAKFAVRKLEGGATMVLSAKPDDSDTAVTDALDAIFKAFLFYNGSFSHVQRRAGTTKKDFRREMRLRCQALVPLIRHHHTDMFNFFQTVPNFPLPQGTNRGFVTASKVLDTVTASYDDVLGGALFINGSSVLVTHLDLSTTRWILNWIESRALGTAEGRTGGSNAGVAKKSKKGFADQKSSRRSGSTRAGGSGGKGRGMGPPTSPTRATADDSQARIGSRLNVNHELTAPESMPVFLRASLLEELRSRRTAGQMAGVTPIPPSKAPLKSLHATYVKPHRTGEYVALVLMTHARITIALLVELRSAFDPKSLDAIRSTVNDLMITLCKEMTEIMNNGPQPLYTPSRSVCMYQGPPLELNASGGPAPVAGDPLSDETTASGRPGSNYNYFMYSRAAKRGMGSSIDTSGAPDASFVSSTRYAHEVFNEDESVSTLMVHDHAGYLYGRRLFGTEAFFQRYYVSNQSFADVVSTIESSARDTFEDHHHHFLY